MAISTYAELQTSISDWLVRDDLAAVVPTFISLAEAAMARDLRHWKQEKRVTTNVDEQYENLPSDFIEPINITLTDGGQLYSISAAEMQARKEKTQVASKPMYIRITADQIEFYPKPDTAYGATLQYYARLEPLSDAAPSNWVLLEYPDVYLYGALVHAAPYLDEDQRTGTWAALYQASVDALNRDNLMSRVSGPLRIGAPR